ncbi:MAG: hypothetical protein ACD_50C00319G0001 [uncultured bacterium]|nr:MAG: hypothetical protein ACD_50C00319G0001 [uncultured bacterium]
MIGMLYTPPFHTADYFKYLANNFGIAKPTHAQGTSGGFTGLLPVQSLWSAFRDIVYFLFVIIFIVIGIAIMLRIRLDPRTVMTIQNQIPRIIIGILLLTFSFAIAGFLIDLMYLTIFVSYNVISTAIPATASLNPLSLQGSTPFAAADGIGGVVGISWGVGGVIKDMITNFLGIQQISSFAGIMALFTSPPNIATIIIGIISLAVGATVGIFTAFLGPGAFVTGGIAAIGTYAAITDFIPHVLAFLLIVVILFIALIRLWITLIITYVSILISVVLSPFWIAGSLLPGSPIGFTAWIRNMIANLAVFPAVIIMFLLAKAFMDAFGSGSSANQFVPPLVGDPGTPSAIAHLIGFGILLMTPNVANMVKQALKAPSISGAPITAAIGAGVAPYTSGARAVAAGYTKLPAPGARGGWGSAARQIFRF